MLDKIDRLSIALADGCVGGAIAGAKATAAAIASLQSKPLSVRALQDYFP